MWTAKLIKKDLIDGLITIVVEYTNGTNTFTETTVIRDLDIRTKIMKRVAELNAVQENFTGIAVGDVDLTPTPPPDPEPIPEPTLKEQLYQTYLDSKAELQAQKLNLDLGIIDQTKYDIYLNETKQALSNYERA